MKKKKDKTNYCPVCRRIIGIEDTELLMEIISIVQDAKHQSDKDYNDRNPDIDHPNLMRLIGRSDTAGKISLDVAKAIDKYSKKIVETLRN